MIVASIVILGTIGLAFGFGLAYVAKKLAVEEDERVEEILDVLPGTNCGGCGNASCQEFAKAVVAGEASSTDCVVGKQEVAKMIAAILGEEVEEVQPMVAQAFCQGGRNQTKVRFVQPDTMTCNTAALIGGGYKECVYGCLNLGDCAEACPFDAITMSEDGLPQIDKEKCTGCGNCVKACPRGIINLVLADAKVHVRCSSKDSGRVVTKICDVGCIGCRRCVRACEQDAIDFDEEANLAQIDYEKCIECGACVEACPKGVIVMEEEISAEEAKAA